MLNRYRKFFVSLLPVVVSGLIALQAAIEDDDWTAQDLAAVMVAVFTSAGVWALSWPEVKGVVALLGAAATAWAVALTDGVVTDAEWVSIAVAALAGIGVTAISNLPEPVTAPPGAHEI